MPAIPLRLVRAVATLDVAPGHRVLEIGGGPGVSAALIGEILARGDGHYLGLDRSALATQRARARNAAHVSAGRAEFRTQALEDAKLPAAAFDRILAVNVNLFWTDPAGPGLGRLRAALKDGGQLVLVYESVASGTETLRPLETVLRTALANNRFTLTRRVVRAEEPRPQLYLVAVPSGG